MKKLKKWRLRSLALTLCLTLFMGVLNPMALAKSYEDDPNWQHQHNEWSPEEDFVVPNTAGDLTF